MAVADEFDTLSRAFSGFGVDERSFISILGKWHPHEKKSFRKGTPQFFSEDDRLFERWDHRHVAQLEHEFLRFKSAVVLWTMHPWERDARLVKEALRKGPNGYAVIIEIACTRSSEELLGARRAYHSLFDLSIEEDVANQVNGIERKLLVALVSSYRYEGPRVHEETAKSEAKILCAAVKYTDKAPIEDEEVVRILATRSKLHLKALSQHYKEISGRDITQDLAIDSNLIATLKCLCSPQVYYSELLHVALRHMEDELAKEALVRVIVTQADVDMKEIKEEYHGLYGENLSAEIEAVAHGNFKDFLLTLIARGD